MSPAQLIQYAHQIPGVICGDQHSATCQRAQEVLTSFMQAISANHSQMAQKARNEAAGLSRTAKTKGDHMVAVQAEAAAGMAEYLRQQILLPPGGCPACMNTRQVPSTLAAGHMTRCPACAQEGAVA